MRQLAAILFADMTGYTSLVQQNEQLARLKRRRLKEVLDKTIVQYNGKVFQYYGDGSLSIFHSVIDSVRCAIDIQQQLQQQEPRVDIRIGIHTGDVMVEDEAIYGDGVNMASRIESLAVPGSIFISEKVFDEIRNQEDISTREMGFFELKNVRHPVRVFAVSNSGLVVPAREDVKGKTKQPANRLAVLPFVNMSADPENEYFSDGITEELLNALTRVKGLQVTSRTSAFAFKGKNDDIRDIATQLNVDKVLEGSVRKAGNKVRITAQLINATDGYHIWSETYDRNLTDIFEVQDEISAIITNKLKENLEEAQPEPVSKTPVKNATAYTYFLKGLHFWNKLTPTDAFHAIEYFEQAIGIEPDYAQAYAMIAGVYSYLGASGQMLPQKAFEIVHRYADKALQLDKKSAEGHTAKASAYLFYEWKWQKAYDCLMKAKHLNPTAIEPYKLLSFYYVVTGNKNEAVKMMEEAEQIDPLSPAVLQGLTTNYVMAGRFDEAINTANKILEIHPTMRTALEMKAWAIGMKGDWPAAQKIFEEVHRLTNHPLKGLMGLAFSSAKLGDREKALDCIRRMEQRQAQEPDAVVDGDLAVAWHGLGDRDKTFYYLNQCIDKRTAPVIYYLEFPAYEDIKTDPRYLELRKRIAEGGEPGVVNQESGVLTQAS